MSTRITFHDAGGLLDDAYGVPIPRIGERVRFVLRDGTATEHRVEDVIHVFGGGRPEDVRDHVQIHLGPAGPQG